jgi:hypothetical protein
MDGWMDGWMDGRMDGWMDRHSLCGSSVAAEVRHTTRVQVQQLQISRRHGTRFQEVESYFASSYRRIKHKSYLEEK